MTVFPPKTPAMETEMSNIDFAKKPVFKPQPAFRVPAGLKGRPQLAANAVLLLAAFGFVLAAVLGIFP